MNEAPKYSIAIFKSVNQTMWAVKILKNSGLPHKLIPMPRHISADCGVCIRIDSASAGAARTELSCVDGFVDIVAL